MIITLADDKKKKFKSLILQLLRIQRFSIRPSAKIIVTIISCMPDSVLGPLFYVVFQKDRTELLKKNKCVFDIISILSVEAKHELE